MNTTKKHLITKIAGTLLFVVLALSVVYAFSSYLKAPVVNVDGPPSLKVKSDFLLMIAQCVLGLGVMMVPRVLECKWKLTLSDVVILLYYAFLFCSIYLGEVRCFYYYVPHWDTVLHCVSGLMLGALAFVVVDALNEDKNISIKLSPLFVALFAFCFSLAGGAIWEIYEFTLDSVMGLNMQKHTTEAGVGLPGTVALADTMKDIIVDALSALVVAITGYFVLRRKRKLLVNKTSDQECEAYREFVCTK